MSHWIFDGRVRQVSFTAHRKALRYRVAQVKNGGMQDNGTLLCRLADLVIIAVITTVDEYLLRSDYSVQ